jgi:hypothetical protein
MKEDLKVWLTFLSNYNETTVIVDKVWSSSTTLGEKVRPGTMT